MDALARTVQRITKMDCSQAVRQVALNHSFAGSNPASPDSSEQRSRVNRNLTMRKAL